MLYHAQSLAARGVDVDLVGYAGELPPSIVENARIACRFLHDVARGNGFLLSLVRLAAQAAQLGWMLVVRLPRPDAVLLQVPPAIPALGVVLLAARLRRARVIVDWHNLTASMLALRLGKRHVAVRAAGAFERTAAWHADAHLCVSRAMAQTIDGWQGTTGVHIFRDRPADSFRRASDDRRREWRQRAAAASGADPASLHRLVVVPTSWGPDDDFDLLLDALDAGERLLDTHGQDDSLIVVLTGLGPRREQYKPRFERRRARRIHACALWLSPQEYVELIGCADLGVSVHRSASGLDLPMKICDLFGAGVPVCALDYGPCLTELVDPGVNGLLFSTAEELARQMCNLLDRDSSARLARLAAGATASAAVRWSEGWSADAWPVFREEMAR